MIQITGYICYSNN